MSDTKDKLVQTLARLQAQRASIAQARQSLQGRAAEQLDSMGPAVQAMQDHLAVDQAGGVLGHRRLQTLLDERERLSRIAGGG